MNKFFKIFKDAVVVNAHAVRTYVQDPLQAFRFRVAIGGINSSIGFKSLGGLSREIEVVEYLENMFEHAHKLPGRESVGEITLERGMYEDKSLETFYKSIFTNSATRFDCTIQITDRVGTVRRSFGLAECWCSGFEVADLDADSSDVLIETLTIQFEHYT